MNLNQVLAVLLIVAVLIVLLGKWVLVPIGIAILLLLIRLGADIYWRLKDKEW